MLCFFILQVLTIGKESDFVRFGRVAVISDSSLAGDDGGRGFGELYSCFFDYFPNTLERIVDVSLGVWLCSFE